MQHYTCVSAEALNIFRAHINICEFYCKLQAVGRKNRLTCKPVFQTINIGNLSFYFFYFSILRRGKYICYRFESN